MHFLLRVNCNYHCITVLITKRLYIFVETGKIDQNCIELSAPRRLNKLFYFYLERNRYFAKERHIAGTCFILDENSPFTKIRKAIKRK